MQKKAPEDRRHANVEEIRSGELFLYYLYQADGNLGNAGYGTRVWKNELERSTLRRLFGITGSLVLEVQNEKTSQILQWPIYI